MSNKDVARTVITAAILKAIVRPKVTYDDADYLAKVIMNELADHDRFICHIPDDKVHSFQRPKD